MAEAVTIRQMRELEQGLIDAGATEAELMEAAGRGLASEILRLAPRGARQAILLAGMGHNAGDGYVALRHLAQVGWHVAAWELGDRPRRKPLTTAMRQRVQGLRILAGIEQAGEAFAAGDVVVLDGIVGLGATRPLRPEAREGVLAINRLGSLGAWVVAIDSPSGMDAEDGRVEAGEAVRAALSVTFGRTKRGLLAQGAEEFVGRLALVELPGLAADEALVTGAKVAGWLPQRTPVWHKGTAGRVAVIAGSAGMTGAAQLCAEAALRAGAGLVTLWADSSSAQVLRGRVAPEVMVAVLRDAEQLSEAKVDCFAAGPGLGKRAAELLPWLQGEERPVVVDADLLNALASAGGDSWRAAGERIWTPHPGEAGRLLQCLQINHSEVRSSRVEIARRLAERSGAGVMLKGGRTVIAAADGSLRFNSTGHPGMASGGMGDVLTGVIAGLRAQGVVDADAAAAGAWLCGRAAELACREGRESWESCRATSVLDWLGAAFTDARAAGLRQLGEWGSE